MTDTTPENHDEASATGENSAADAGSESPEEGEAAMDAAEDAVSHEERQGPDVEKSVTEQPFIDVKDELNDSADSYISPARADRPTQGGAH